jgi:hypothetical protein
MTIKSLYGILLMIIGQAMVFMQIYAPLKIEALDNNWFKYGMAIPISFVFIEGIRLFLDGTETNWGSRFMLFTTGTIIFAIMNHQIFGETINLKTITCLGLCLMIILIQMYWK